MILLFYYCNFMCYLTYYVFYKNNLVFEILNLVIFTEINYTVW